MTQQVFEKMQDAAAATGNGTPLSCAHRQGAIVHVFGTFVGTITWECSLNGTDWRPIAAADLGVVGRTRELTTTAPKMLLFDFVQGIAIRARISAYTSGAINAWGVAVG